MQSAIDYKRFAVLFVDDEAPTVRLFDKYYSKYLRVFTAGSVDAAAEVLEAHGEEIGVLITDQRMPGRQGVDLLKLVRKRYPDIVRILTTGYTDLADAIEAVNRGEIFRYITKPWNPTALRDELMHAMELFVLRRERDLFVEEKLSVRQHQTQSDRLRDLVAMCGSLPGVRRPLHAVRSLLLQLIELAPTPPIEGWEELDHWGLIHKETQSMLALGRRVSRAFAGGALEVDETLDAGALISAALERAGNKVDGSALPSSLPTIQGNGRLLEQLFGLLLMEAGRLRGEEAVRLVAEEVSGALHLRVEIPGATLPPPKGTLLSSPPGTKVDELPLHGELLAAYLIAHHHGGSIELSGRDGVTLDLRLPTAPIEITDDALEEDWMEEILVRFEGWD